MSARKRSEQRQRTAMLATRATPAEAARIRKAAEDAGLSVSAFLISGAGLLANLAAAEWPSHRDDDHDAAVQIAKRVLREGGDPAQAVHVLERSLARAA